MAPPRNRHGHGGRSHASHAGQVCATCKARKKKCDKVLPRCGYCVRKGLGACEYEVRLRNHAAPVASPIPAGPAVSETNLYLQAQGLIRATGQFVDDISARYFRGFHRRLPFISHPRFHDSLVTLGATPSADFSVLLLSICLVTYSTKLEKGDGHATSARTVDPQSLHLAVRSLLAQVQGLYPPSVHLIQAGMLLSVYEYVHSRPEEAFVSIAGCARMAYAIRIHRPLLQPPLSQKAVPITNPDTVTDLQLQAEEAANTWWAIIVCERKFFCEVSVPEQPLVTTIPSGDVRLPTEPRTPGQTDFLGPESVPHVSVSCLGSVDVGGFGRTAQATWLLDRVLKGFIIPDLGSRLSQLQDLDTTLLAFLRTLVGQKNKCLDFCEAISIAIRALFTLHWHIIGQPRQIAGAMDQSREEWCQYSDAALNTALKMVVDIAEFFENSYSCSVASTLGYPYIARASLKHIYGKAEWEHDKWLRSAEERLRISLDRYGRVWNVSSYQTVGDIPAKGQC